jgi:CheY-like chemotaxis protein
MPKNPLIILLAEDNRADVFLVRRALEEVKLEHELHVAKDGEEAIRFIDDNAASTGLVLVDLNLPRVSGQEVLRHLQNNPRWASVPVIVLTSSDSPADRAEAARLGAKAYFRKPSKLEEFMRLGEVVKQLVEEEKA